MARATRRFGRVLRSVPRVTANRGLQVVGSALSALLAAGVLGPTEAEACQTCAQFDYLCCDIPADGEFYLTSFEGEGMACGGYADGQWYYATSWVRWYCGAKLQITNPANGACAVVEVADAGPAAWVEDSAGKPIVDASTAVCLDLFGSSSCGWSDHRLIEVVQVDDDTPTGPEGCAPLSPPLDAELTDSGAEIEPDSEGGADYRVCAGDPIALWFEVRNIGSSPWVDINATGTLDWGQSVRIGVPEGADDPFVDAARISVNDSSNPTVNPSDDEPIADECYDLDGCPRTRFTVRGTAPAAPGIYQTRWQLIDEGRDWFGPELSATVRVEDCSTPDDPDVNPPDDPDVNPPDDPDDPDDPDVGPPDDPPTDPPADQAGAMPLSGGCQVTQRGAGNTGNCALALLFAGLFLLGRLRPRPRHCPGRGSGRRLAGRRWPPDPLDRGPKSKRPSVPVVCVSGMTNPAVESSLESSTTAPATGLLSSTTLPAIRRWGAPF